MPEKTNILRRALLSLSNREGLVELATTLQQKEIQLVCSAGTALFLKQAGVNSQEVSDCTNFPEILGGRVKTLHPHIFAAILADLNQPSHQEDLKKQGIQPLDLVVCNPYPFDSDALGTDLEKAVEQVDIGGISLIRAAAKNFERVCVVCDPEDYPIVQQQILQQQALNTDLRHYLAVKAWQFVVDYDAKIAMHFSQILMQQKRQWLNLGIGKPLRYGENPHQKAWLYAQSGVANAEQLAGVPLSYNNYQDATAAWSLVNRQKSALMAVIVKHAGPCGAATADTALTALDKAWQSDSKSAFGGVLAFNHRFTLDQWEFLQPKTGPKKFVEVLIAPNFEPAVVQAAQQNKIRLLQVKTDAPVNTEVARTWEVKSIHGGFLQQQTDAVLLKKLSSPTKLPFPKKLLGLASFGLGLCCGAKSNAVVVVWQDANGYYQLLGVGAGQPNRVDAVAKLALPKAMQILKEHAERLNQPFEVFKAQQLGSIVLVSDAFFPFADSIQIAAEQGICLVVQPGGSKRDPEVIKTCDQLGVAMAFSHLRHFSH